MKWIKVTLETLPPDGEAVMVTVNVHHPFSDAKLYSVYAEGCLICNGYVLAPPDHIATVRAKDFQSACRKAVKAVGHSLLYDKKTNTYNGRRLFDGYEAARKETRKRYLVDIYGDD